jgi:hypothetical protein
MKIKIPVHAVWAKIKPAGSPYIILKEADEGSKPLIDRLFAKKKEWEDRNGKEWLLQAELDLRYQKRTFKQNAAVWVLVTTVFESMEGRKPTEEEKYGLYLDLLELYADKVPNRLTGELRPIHISESNSVEGSRFIDGLLHHLATMCDLDYDTQSTVISVLQEWEAWRGTLDSDPSDYADIACTTPLSLEAWEAKHSYSEASGKGGPIVRAHIVSRGADAADIEQSWNWMALLPEEHEQQHRMGWDGFLRIYPHLLGKVERARRLAGKLKLSDQKVVEYKAENLAREALGEV